MADDARGRDDAPLFDVGFHRYTLKTAEAALVTAFPESQRRAFLFSELLKVIARLRADKVRGQLWVNGSFVTRKPDPADIDLLLVIKEAELRPNDLRYVHTLRWFASQAKEQHCCDGNVFVEPKPLRRSQWDRRYWLAYWARCYWTSLFGYTRSHDVKGIVIVSF